MENILLDADGHIKIIDFGHARWLNYGARTSTICGTLQYMGLLILNFTKIFCAIQKIVI